MRSNKRIRNNKFSLIKLMLGSCSFSLKYENICNCMLASKKKYRQTALQTRFFDPIYKRHFDYSFKYSITQQLLNLTIQR